jgi:hypothetical protein
MEKQLTLLGVGGSWKETTFRLKKDIKLELFFLGLHSASPISNTHSFFCLR